MTSKKHQNQFITKLMAILCIMLLMAVSGRVTRANHTSEIIIIDNILHLKNFISSQSSILLPENIEFKIEKNVLLAKIDTTTDILYFSRDNKRIKTRPNQNYTLKDARIQNSENNKLLVMRTIASMNDDDKKQFSKS